MGYVPLMNAGNETVGWFRLILLEKYLFLLLTCIVPRLILRGTVALGSQDWSFWFAIDFYYVVSISYTSFEWKLIELLVVGLFPR